MDGNFVSFTDLIWPVDSIYFSKKDTGLNPAEVFGGSWELITFISQGNINFNAYIRIS